MTIISTEAPEVSDIAHEEDKMVKWPSDYVWSGDLSLTAMKHGLTINFVCRLTGKYIFGLYKIKLNTYARWFYGNVIKNLKSSVWLLAKCDGPAENFMFHLILLST